MDEVLAMFDDEAPRPISTSRSTREKGELGFAVFREEGWSRDSAGKLTHTIFQKSQRS